MEVYELKEPEEEDAVWVGEGSPVEIGMQQEGELLE